MRVKKLLFGLIVGLLVSIGWMSSPVQAAGIPQIFDIVIPNDYDPAGLDIFGANDTDQGLPVAIDVTLGDFTNLTSTASGDLIFGAATDSTGTFTFLVHGEDENPIGGGWDMEITKVDTSGSIQAGWPNLFDSAGGVGGAYAANGFVRMIPDTSGGVWVLYFVGTNDPPGPPDSTRVLQITHFNSAGAETGGFPISLGDTSGDMIADGSGGVYVVFSMGPDILSAGLTHGSARHITTAGIDGAWAGGSGILSLSSDAITTKQGLTLVSDAVGGGIALWNEAGGIYGQRFTSTGTLFTGWATRGNLIYASASVSTTDRVRGAQSGSGEYYAVFRESGTVSALSFDNIGAARWSCVQTLDNESGYVAIGGNDVTTPGLYVVFGDDSMRAQLFAEATGNSIWSIGGEDITGGSDVDSVFPDQSFIENTSAGVVANSAGTGFRAVYSNSDSGDQNPVATFAVPTTFAAGAGNDCAAGAVPDAIVDLVAIAGDTEVDLGWTAPADNGSAITDYIIEFREFPGGTFSTFNDGVSTSVSATVTGLTNGQAYEFRVSAVNGIGTGPVSNLDQATPQSLNSGRRQFETGGPRFFLGQVRDESASAAAAGRLRGSALVNEVNQLLGESFQAEEEDGGIRILSDDPEFLSRLSRDRTELLQLIDLIVALRKLYSSWMYPENYTLLGQHHELRDKSATLFLTRFFHHKIGVEYLKRGQLSTYDFDYKYPVDSETEILVDFARSTLLTVGRACYDPSVLDYAEELDYPDSPNWYVRYVEVLRPWFEQLYGTSQFALIKPMNDLRVLEAYYLLLFGFCLGEELGLDVTN